MFITENSRYRSFAVILLEMFVVRTERSIAGGFSEVIVVCGLGDLLFRRYRKNVRIVSNESFKMFNFNLLH